MLEPAYCLRRHWLIMLLLALLGGLQAVAVVKHLAPVSRDSYIDLNSGLLRYEYSFLSIHYRTLVYEGSVARRYRKYVGEPPATKDWAYIQTVGMGCWKDKLELNTNLHWADYVYQNVVGNVLDKRSSPPYGNQYGYTTAAKREVILQSLALLRKYRSTDQAANYVMFLDERLTDIKHIADLADLPAPEELIGPDYRGSINTVENQGNKIPAWCRPIHPEWLRANSGESVE